MKFTIMLWIIMCWILFSVVFSNIPLKGQFCTILLYVWFGWFLRVFLECSELGENSWLCMRMSSCINADMLVIRESYESHALWYYFVVFIKVRMLMTCHGEFFFRRNALRQSFYWTYVGVSHWIILILTTFRFTTCCIWSRYDWPYRNTAIDYNSTAHIDIDNVAIFY